MLSVVAMRTPCLTKLGVKGGGLLKVDTDAVPYPSSTCGSQGVFQGVAYDTLLTLEEPRSIFLNPDQGSNPSRVLAIG